MKKNFSVLLLACFTLILSISASRPAYAKAQCPMGMTLEQCCGSRDTLTQTECSSSCLGTCNTTTAYYAGCATCVASELPKLCDYISLATCQANCSGTCVQGGTKCYNCQILAVVKPVSGSCPEGTTISADSCCCLNN